MTYPATHNNNQPRHKFRIFRPASTNEITYYGIQDLLYATLGFDSGLRPRPQNCFGATLLKESTLRNLEKSSPGLATISPMSLRQRLMNGLPATSRESLEVPITGFTGFQIQDTVHFAAKLDAPPIDVEKTCIWRTLSRISRTRPPVINDCVHVSLARFNNGFQDRVTDETIHAISSLIGPNLILGPVATFSVPHHNHR